MKLLDKDNKTSHNSSQSHNNHNNQNNPNTKLLLTPVTEKKRAKLPNEMTTTLRSKRKEYTQEEYMM